MNRIMDDFYFTKYLNIMKKGKTYEFKKSHSFKDLTVRKHFKGSHTLAIIVNGEKLADKKFEII